MDHDDGDSKEIRRNNQLLNSQNSKHSKFIVNDLMWPDILKESEQYRVA